MVHQGKQASSFRSEIKHWIFVMTHTYQIPPINDTLPIQSGSLFEEIWHTHGTESEEARDTFPVFSSWKSRASIQGWEDILALPLTNQDDCEMDFSGEEGLTSSSHHLWDVELLELQKAYEQSDVRKFAEIVDGINWCTKPAQFFKQVIEMALELEDVPHVRKLASTGHKLHPADESLQRAAFVFAPPKVIATNRPAKKGLSEFMQWFDKHGKDYYGNWVAVKSGELLATATSREQLANKLSNIGDNSDIVISLIK